MHILAIYYHWGRDSLYSLKRSERKMWVDMIKEWEEEKAKQLNKHK